MNKPIELASDAPARDVLGEYFKNALLEPGPVTQFTIKRSRTFSYERDTIAYRAVLLDTNQGWYTAILWHYGPLKWQVKLRPAHPEPSAGTPS